MRGWYGHTREDWFALSGHHAGHWVRGGGSVLMIIKIYMIITNWWFLHTNVNVLRVDWPKKYLDLFGHCPFQIITFYFNCPDIVWLWDSSICDNVPCSGTTNKQKFWPLQSNPGLLWHMRHLIRVIRRHDLTKKIQNINFRSEKWEQLKKRPLI